MWEAGSLIANTQQKEIHVKILNVRNLKNFNLILKECKSCYKTFVRCRSPSAAYFIQAMFYVLALLSSLCEGCHYDHRTLLFVHFQNRYRDQTWDHLTISSMPLTYYLQIY